MMVTENFTHELKYIISTNYNIGDLMDFKQIHLGSVNKSFVIRTAGENKKKRIFLENIILAKPKVK